MSSSSLFSRNKNDGRGDVGEDSGSWKIDPISKQFLLPSRLPFHLYVLHKAFVAIVLPGYNSGGGVYVGNNIEQDLSLAI